VGGGAQHLPAEQLRHLSRRSEAETGSGGEIVVCFFLLLKLVLSQVPYTDCKNVPQQQCQQVPEQQCQQEPYTASQQVGSTPHSIIFAESVFFKTSLTRFARMCTGRSLRG